MRCPVNAYNGIVVVDKPEGISSAKVVAKVKRLFKAKRAGHTGTLDPFASGVMICCLNRATRLSRFFLEGDKTYEAVLRLGVETDTQDSTGTITQTGRFEGISEKRIIEILAGFIGVSDQFPPVYSALKHKGTPLYKLARKGRPVQKPARRIEIYDIRVTHIDLPEVRFEVSCSAGTYIRTLCADIGKKLGCGGHLKKLRRTRSCGFQLANALDFTTLEQLETAGHLGKCVIPMAKTLPQLPETVADERIAEKIFNGKPILKNELCSWKKEMGSEHSDGFIKVLDCSDNLIAVIKDVENSEKYNYCCVFPS